ncbi:MAG: ABC transporter substrate-binding protein [Streptosporangiaceae bacterium]|nr:ABC transporter substrate-binding protein [Streptosporangiaceae bacterium]
MRRSSALLAAVAVTAAATACGSGGSTHSTTSSSSAQIKVGMIAPLTGPFAPLGQGDEQGADIAVSQLNAAGGIDGHKVDLIIKDDKTDPTQSLIDFQALQGEGVAAVLGSSVSDSARAVAPKAEQAQIPYISLSPVDQTVNPVQPYVFLVPAVTTTYANRLMQWFKAEGITRIAVGYDNTDIYTTNGYHSTLSQAPSYGVKVVDTEVFQITTTDFSTIVSHVAGSGAQAFLVWATGPAPVILTKTFSGAGLAAKMKLVMTPSDATTLYTRPAGPAANGVVMAAALGVIAPQLPQSPIKTAIGNLATPFAAKYGGQPSEFAADAYSGAELLFAALKQAAPGFSGSAIQSALSHLSLLTPDGEYHYTQTDHSGLTPDDVAMVVVQDGAFQPTPWQKTQYSTLPG